MKIDLTRVEQNSANGADREHQRICAAALHARDEEIFDILRERGIPLSGPVTFVRDERGRIVGLEVAGAAAPTAGASTTAPAPVPDPPAAPA